MKNEADELQTDLLRKQLAAYSSAAEISRVINGAPSLERVINTLTLGLRDTMNFHRICLFRLNRDHFRLDPWKFLGLKEKSLEKLVFGLDFLAGEYSDSIFRNRHIIVESTPDYDEFYKIGCKRYLTFPLFAHLDSPLDIWDPSENNQNIDEDARRKRMIKNEDFNCLGLIWLDLSNREMVTAEEVSMLSSIMAQSAMAIENHLIKEKLEKSNGALQKTNEALQNANRVIQRDLERAHGVQQRLLPTKFPESIPDVAAHYVPHNEVGGDYYDCFDIDENNIGLVIADVSGHGVTAALIMSMFKMLLKSSAPNIHSPSETLNHINDTLLRELNSDQFVTVFYGIFDRSTRTLTYTNAGHDAILLFDSSDQLMELKSRGLFVGVLEQTNLTDAKLQLDGAHRIVLYTDGITESMDENGAMFGRERLTEICQRKRVETCRTLIRTIIRELDDFTGMVVPDDDITLLICDL